MHASNSYCEFSINIELLFGLKEESKRKRGFYYVYRMGTYLARNPYDAYLKAQKDYDKYPEPKIGLQYLVGFREYF